MGTLGLFNDAFSMHRVELATILNDGLGRMC